MLPLLLALTPAPAPALPMADISWRHELARVAFLPPSGEHLNAAAPVEGWFQVDQGPRYSVATDGAALAGGLWIAAPGKVRALSGQMRLSLCTDSGNACRVVDLSFETPLSGSHGEAMIRPTLPRVEEPPPPSEGHVWPGVAEAEATAKSQGGLVLVDFATAWCPPCNLLSAQVLENPVDKPALSGFVLTRVDADTAASWDIKSRYKVGGYPTVLALRPDGTEVDRLVGFPGEQETLAWLQTLPSVTPLGALPAPEQLSPTDALGAALRLARADAPERAKPYLDRLTPALAPDLQGSKDLHLARFLVSPSAEEAKWLLASGVDPEDWLDQAATLAEKDASLRAPLHLAIQAQLTKAKPADAADLLWVAGSLAEAEKSADAPVLYGAGALLLQSALSGDPVADRGYWTELADLYSKAGDLDRALGVLQDAIGRYPHEFTYLYAAGGLLQDAGKAEQALPYGLGALAVSTGDTRLRAARLCAELLHSLHRDPEALQIIDDTLAAAPKPGLGVDVRTTRYLKTLADTRAEIASPPKPDTASKAKK